MGCPPDWPHLTTGTLFLVVGLVARQVVEFVGKQAFQLVEEARVVGSMLQGPLPILMVL